MATYYRWAKKTIKYETDESCKTTGSIGSVNKGSDSLNLHRSQTLVNNNDGTASLAQTTDYVEIPISSLLVDEESAPLIHDFFPYNTDLKWFAIKTSGLDDNDAVWTTGENVKIYCKESGNQYSVYVEAPSSIGFLSITKNGGTFIDYVYSTSSSAYPNGGASGEYYYDQRTTVTSPTQPTGLTYPNPITTQKVTVSWQAATSNVPDYPVSGYQVDVSTNGGTSWTTAGTPTTNSLTYSITPGTTSIMFRVRAKDSNGQWGSYVTGTASQVLLAPTLTVPQMLMQGQQATVNWTAIEGADSYTLQRKSSADADWTQVYSGANTTFSETAGTWTTVQYRVQAVFDGTPGGWATSAEIPVVSASALVISGQDGDLGTLVNDVPYSISTDTGNQITATITANGAVIFSGNVGNSVADVIPVLDLINGSGTIVIEASVTASSGPVSAVRTWTYTKTMMTFPNAGSIAELTKDGKVMWPETLAEAVRIPGGKTLDQVMGFPCQIYTGSYVGTGTYGEDNPNTLTFPFRPKMWSVVGTTRPDTDYYASLSNVCFLPWGLEGNARLYGSSSLTATISYEDNTVEFYSSNTSPQLNESGWTYYYVALG